ncbi:MAG: ABC transporter ATP-binding protein [Spirochaetota bacterium]
MIELSGVSRDYGTFFLGASVNVDDHELLTLFGESGSGKTTILRLVAGFEKPDHGRILVGGRDVTDLPPERREIGYVFQDYTLFPHLTVGQNIAYGLRVQKKPSHERHARVRELLALTELEGFEDRAVSRLSGGEQQRVALARALAPSPKALLLDEPFSAIDTERRGALRLHLLNIQRAMRIPTIFVTHSRTEALYLSDRLVIMRNGEIVEEGTPRDLYERPRTLYAARFTGSVNTFSHEKLKRLPEQWLDGPVPNTTPDNSGETVAVLRPEKITFSANREPVKNGACLDGVIRHVGYFGSYCLYLIETEVGDLEVQEEPGYTNGEPVKLCCGDGAIHLLG